MSSTPSALGYRMPAEWEAHDATWLAWPHNTETWPGKRLAQVGGIYLQMLEALLPHEKVHVLVNDEREEKRVRNLIKKIGSKARNLETHEVFTADAWIRDYGPTFVTGARGKAWCKWIFNAWGGKYASLAEDNHVFSARKKGGSSENFGGQKGPLIMDPCFVAGIVLEGGSVEVNGRGACLTTEQCLLNKNRNPSLSKTEIEAMLKNFLGVSQIIWLGEGIVGDDTDGHIDELARFVNPTTIVAAYEEDASDPNHKLLKENWERLKRGFNEKGSKWDLVKLPMPGKVADGGTRLPASYANFYIANSVILLPAYDHPNDDRAKKILQEFFPKREIVTIPCRSLVYGLGAIHCVTQQEPSLAT